MKDLSEQQRKLAKEFIKTGNAAKAATAVGYSPKHVSRLINSDKMQAYIKELQSEMAARSGRSLAAVMADIHDVAIRAREAGDFKAELKALELEAKHLGAFVQKIEVNQTAGLVASIKDARRRVRLQNVTDVEPVALPAGGDEPDWL